MPETPEDPWAELTPEEKRRLPRLPRSYPPKAPPAVRGDFLTPDEVRAWDVFEAVRDADLPRGV